MKKKCSGEPDPVEVGDKGWLNKPQPLRTDMEAKARGSREIGEGIEYVDVKIEARDG